MHFAVISGLSASLGSLFGKLVGSSSLEGLWIARLICVLLMLIFNTASLNFYIKSLHVFDSTLSATMSSTASNYIFSAIFGFILFNEATSFLWWTGLFFIMCGLVLIVRDEQKTDDSKKIS